MRFLIIPVFGFILLMTNLVSGQTKYEREYRLQVNAVPEQAIAFIDSIGAEKVRWYYEENLAGNSIEAKFKFLNRNFSIEFDTLGKLQDAEIEIGWGEIELPIQNKIQRVLDSLFVAHKIKRIQIQFSGPSYLILLAIGSDTTPLEITTRYEMIVKGKTDGRPRLYEITFSENGFLLQKAKIIFKNTDNLEF